MSDRERNQKDGEITGLGTAIGAAFGDGIVGAPAETSPDASSQADRPTTLDAVPDSAEESAATPSDDGDAV